MANITVKELGGLVESMQNLLDISSKNFSELNKNVLNMQGDINYLKVENEEIKLKQKDMTKKLEDSSEKATKALEKITVRGEDNFDSDWLGQKDLGLMYEPVISSKQMGNILREIGLAMKKRTITNPLQKTLKAGYAKRGYKAGWYWYADKVKSEFEKYLKNKNIYEKFLTLNTEKEMSDFINANILNGDVKI